MILRTIIVWLLICSTLFSATTGEFDPATRYNVKSWKRNDEAANLMAASTEQNRVQIIALQALKFGDKDALNWRPLQEILQRKGMLTESEMQSKRLNTLDQEDVGSCVGWATTIAGDHLLANQTKNLSLRLDFRHRIDPATTYALGRQAANQLFGWDGSTGAWSVKGLKEYGYLNRKKYDGFDLSNTTPRMAKHWAAKGVPQQYIQAIQFKGSAVRAEKVSEVKAALQGGLTAIVCAQASYPSTRDSLGFSRRSGRAWAHAMAVIAYRGPDSGREGYLIQNSWTRGPDDSEWNSGPVWPPDQPKGSFWVTAQDLQYHLDQNDSWILTKLDSYERANLTGKEIFNFKGLRLKVVPK